MTQHTRASATIRTVSEKQDDHQINPQLLPTITTQLNILVDRALGNLAPSPHFTSTYWSHPHRCWVLSLPRTSLQALLLLDHHSYPLPIGDDEHRRFLTKPEPNFDSTLGETWQPGPREAVIHLVLTTPPGHNLYRHNIESSLRPRINPIGL